MEGAAGRTSHIITAVFNVDDGIDGISYFIELRRGSK